MILSRVVNSFIHDEATCDDDDDDVNEPYSSSFINDIDEEGEEEDFITLNPYLP